MKRSAMNNSELNKQDVQNLAHSPQAEAKSVVAQKVGAYYNGRTITPNGKKLAEDIFRIMVRDIETKVRQILADSLKNCRNLPSDIVNAVINDIDAVATPFLQYYSDLSNEDLIKILNMPSINKQKAVAGRLNLPNEISEYIVEKCSEEVVGVLISNDTADIQEKTFSSILTKYPQSEDIKKRLVYRAELPTSIIEKIANFLSEDLKKRLILSHNLPSDLASDIVEEVKEKTTLRISEEYSSDKQIEELVHQLYTSNRLTPSLVVRAICLGDIKFFEYAIVYLSNTPILEVRKILFNTPLDFMIRNLLRKAFIPKSMFPAVFSALKIIREIKFDCCRTDRKTFGHKVIERILSYAPNNEELSEEDIRYLVSKIN
ncbi:MAG: DUF2336 domain-containing protein [Alphaproteobacteria bacterium]|nr:DUF2336 domain-containing protein [Alphaproteobacteria bacterium]